MKSLLEYIYESTESGDSTTSKNISLNFKSLNNGEETINKVIELCNNHNLNCLQSDEKLNITITRANCDKGEVDELYDFLNDYTTNLRKEIKNASDESYAQKTLKFKNNVESINDFMNAAENEEEKIKDNKEEKKEEIKDNNDEE